MTNFLLLIGLLAPAVHTQTPPAQPTAQVALQTSVAQQPALGQVAKGMNAKSVVQALGQPERTAANHVGGQTYFWIGEPCARQSVGCMVRFDDSGHATMFDNIKPALML